jgi:hypothetical protein
MYNHLEERRRYTSKRPKTPNRTMYKCLPTFPNPYNGDRFPYHPNPPPSPPPPPMMMAMTMVMMVMSHSTDPHEKCTQSVMEMMEPMKTAQPV